MTVNDHRYSFRNSGSSPEYRSQLVQQVIDLMRYKQWHTSPMTFECVKTVPSVSRQESGLVAVTVENQAGESVPDPELAEMLRIAIQTYNAEQNERVTG